MPFGSDAWSRRPDRLPTSSTSLTTDREEVDGSPDGWEGRGERCQTATWANRPRGSPAASISNAPAAAPDGYQEVLVLHDIEGYTHREIGDLLGIEPGTSKSQLSRARRTIRDWLTSTGERSGQSTIEHSITPSLRGVTPGEVEA